MPARTYSARLTPDEIASTRARHSIVDVLERAGAQAPGRGSTDFMISCPRPEHEDATPSCAVHPATGTFYCFGCGARGDVFTLVTELTGMSSLARIAELLDSGGQITPAAGVFAAPRVAAVPIGAAIDRPQLDRTPLNRVLEVNEEAWGLLTGPRSADRGRLYLARRSIDVWRLEAHVGQPLIGHTPADRGALSAHLRRRGFSSDEIVDAGWGLRRDDGMIDRLHGRALLPIRDDEARVLGVIGRDITDRAKQKYLNTARTIAFCKGSVLYRPTFALAADGATVIVCEGPLDALAIASAAAQQRQASTIVAVAPSGTALTAEQARQVLAISDRPPILCADGDDAGITASAKWARTFRSLGSATRTVTLPDGHDPASWLASSGTIATLLDPGARSELQATRAQRRPLMKAEPATYATDHAISI